MLYWRLIIGIPTVVLFAALCYLDMWMSNKVEVRGIVLLPLFLVFLTFLCDEILDLLEAAGLHPRRSSVFFGTLSMAVCSWIACVYQGHQSDIVSGTVSSHAWPRTATASIVTLLVMAGGIMVAFVGEMRRYVKPGGTVSNLAGGMFAIMYIGLLSCFVIQLRMAFGIGAVLSLIIVAKLCDTGAYTVGRIIGSHKMVPGISPGKTIEGMIGGIAFSVFGAWLWFCVLYPWSFTTVWIPGSSHPTSFLGWFSFGIVIALSGALGDLAASLIKRDVKRKDSSSWMPGFGGFLDLFDSLLFAAPLAYAWWAFGLVG